MRDTLVPTTAIRPVLETERELNVIGGLLLQIIFHLDNLNL